MKDERGLVYVAALAFRSWQPHSNVVCGLRSTTDSRRAVGRLMLCSSLRASWKPTDQIFWGVDIEASQLRTSTTVIRVSATPDEGRRYARRLDVSQRLIAPTDLTREKK